MRDGEIDTSDIPEPTTERLARTVARRGLEPLPRKQQVTLPVDDDVLEWFKARGPDYETRINELLRAYKKAHEGG